MLMIETLKGDLGMRVQLALQSLEFYLPAQLIVPGFNISTCYSCRPSSSEVDSTWSTNAILRKWEVFKSYLGTLPVLCQERIHSEHVAKPCEDP